MATERTFWKPLGIYHEVNSGEVSSGMARVLILNSAPASATNEFVFVTQVRSLADEIKTEFIADYNPSSGVVDITNDTDSLATGDKVSIIGMFYT